MEEKEYNEKPFNNYQYDFLSHRYVEKKEFNENLKEIKEQITRINNLSENNTRNLKIILSGLKWLGGTAGVLVISQIFDFFINLGK